MPVPLDFVGNVTTAIQVTILFLLILGLPLVKGRKEKQNLVRHGYLTGLALILHTITIGIVMVPSLSNSFGSVEALSSSPLLVVWLHILTGVSAEALGIVLIVLWARKPLNHLACLAGKRLMLPTFVIWSVSAITGILIHAVGII